MIKTANITDYVSLRSFLGRSVILGLKPEEDINNPSGRDVIFCIGRLNDARKFLECYLDDDMLENIGHIPIYSVDRLTWIASKKKVDICVPEVVLTPENMRYYNPKVILTEQLSDKKTL